MLYLHPAAERFAVAPVVPRDMARKGEDPMSGLLSNVGGIDSSLFQKPQSLKDLRGQGSPVKTTPEQRQSFQPQQHVRASPASDPRPTITSSASVGASKKPSQQFATHRAQTASESNRQLDALLGTSAPKSARSAYYTDSICLLKVIAERIDPFLGPKRLCPCRPAGLCAKLHGQHRRARNLRRQP